MLHSVISTSSSYYIDNIELFYPNSLSYNNNNNNNTSICIGFNHGFYIWNYKKSMIPDESISMNKNEENEFIPISSTWIELNKDIIFKQSKILVNGFIISNCKVGYHEIPRLNSLSKTRALRANEIAKIDKQLKDSHDFHYSIYIHNANGKKLDSLIAESEIDGFYYNENEYLITTYLNKPNCITIWNFTISQHGNVQPHSTNEIKIDSQDEVLLGVQFIDLKALSFKIAILYYSSSLFFLDYVNRKIIQKINLENQCDNLLASVDNIKNELILYISSYRFDPDVISPPLEKKAKKNIRSRLIKSNLIEIKRFQSIPLASPLNFNFELNESRSITPLALPESFLNKFEYECYPKILSMCKSKKFLMCGSEIGTIYIFDIFTFKLRLIFGDSYHLSCEYCIDPKCLLHTTKNLNNKCTMCPILYLSVDDNNLYAVNKQGNIYVYSISNI